MLFIILLFGKMKKNEPVLNVCSMASIVFTEDLLIVCELTKKAGIHATETIWGVPLLKHPHIIHFHRNRKNGIINTHFTSPIATHSQIQ